MSKSLLIIFEAAPFESHRMREGLDFVLAMSAVFTDIQLIFTGNALQALQINSPYQGTNRDFTRTFKSLEHYDIEHCYTDQELDNMIIDLEILDEKQIEALKSTSDHIFIF